jgi:hypothetical protein
MSLTQPQKERAWSSLLAQHPCTTEVVHRWDNGWTIQRLTTDDDIRRVGKMMHNCWQNDEATVIPSVFQELDDETLEQMEFIPSRHHTINDEHGLPQVAFFSQPSYLVGGPQGPRQQSPTAAEHQMLWEFKHQEREA